MKEKAKYTIIQYRENFEAVNIGIVVIKEKGCDYQMTSDTSRIQLLFPQISVERTKIAIGFFQYRLREIKNETELIKFMSTRANEIKFTKLLPMVITDNYDINKEFRYFVKVNPSTI